MRLLLLAVLVVVVAGCGEDAPANQGETVKLCSPTAPSVECTTGIECNDNADCLTSHPPLLHALRAPERKPENRRMR